MQLELRLAPFSCPHCRGQVRTSARHSRREQMLALMLLCPYRCRACRRRFWRFSWPLSGRTRRRLL